MNVSEIRYIEEQLRAAPRLPLAEDQYAEIIRQAKRARAEALAEIWHSFKVRGAAVAARAGALLREFLDRAGSSNHGRYYR